MSRSRPILLLLLAVSTASIVACSEQGQVTLQFKAADLPRFNTLQFYVHDVELLDAEGRAHAVKLTQQSPWQNERVALIDLSAAVADGGHSSLRGEVANPPSAYVGLRFSLGVPFDINHANPLQAKAPLDRTDMFWAWQTGYKFLRADWTDAGQETSFHLGSTGCSSASALRPPSKACGQPNVTRIELRGFDPLHLPVQIHTAPLLQVMRGAARRACTGDYSTDANCAAAYALIGFDSEGRCPGSICSAQKLFAVL